MARQPIVDRERRVVAYELLFRRGPENRAGLVGDADSAQALVSALVDIGLDGLVQDKKAFFIVPERLLHGNLLHVLPQEKVVLEIEPSDLSHENHAETISGLVQMGYTLAATGPGPTDQIARFCRIVKVDARSSDASEHREELSELKERGVTLLAHKVETEERFLMLKELGFEQFQGFYFGEPEVLEGWGIPPNKVSLWHLLETLQRPDFDFEDLQRAISNDVFLSYRMLKLVSSDAFLLKGKVSSVAQALKLLGLNRALSLARLLTIADADEHPSELLVLGMIRGRMCETIAQAHGFGDPDMFFTAGLLSTLGSLLDKPMESLTGSLPLAPELRDALINGKSTSELGRTLRLTLAYEQSDWDSVANLRDLCTNAEHHYVEAVNWALRSHAALAA